jgi:hypothetical protein
MMKSKMMAAGGPAMKSKMMAAGGAVKSKMMAAGGAMKSKMAPSGGMPMVKRGDKMVPAFAVDGKGKDDKAPAKTAKKTVKTKKG